MLTRPKQPTQDRPPAPPTKSEEPIRRTINLSEDAARIYRRLEAASKPAHRYKDWALITSGGVHDWQGFVPCKVDGLEVSECRLIHKRALHVHVGTTAARAWWRNQRRVTR